MIAADKLREQYALCEQRLAIDRTRLASLITDGLISNEAAQDLGDQLNYVETLLKETLEAINKLGL